MTASASVSAGSGAGCSGTTAFSTVGAGASAGGAASGMFFLSSAICKPPFLWHEKSQPDGWQQIGDSSFQIVVYENATHSPVGQRNTKRLLDFSLMIATIIL